MLHMLALFSVVGIIDKLILRGRLGYGEKFEEGIKVTGQLILSMAGIMCMAPVIGSGMEIMMDLTGLAGEKAAIAIGIILAPDMGGYPLVCSLTENMEVRRLCGLYMGSMIGSALCFGIPVAMELISEKDYSSITKGILAGIAAVPIGTAAAAIFSGMKLRVTFFYIIPAAAVACILIIGLICVPQKVLYIFCKCSSVITFLAYSFLAIAILKTLTGIALFKNMASLGNQLEIIGFIGITLAGAFPMVSFFSKTMYKPCRMLGKVIGISHEAVVGMLACTTNIIPMYEMFKNMSDEDKVIAMAFSVCAGFAFGDHMAYVMNVDRMAMFPLIGGKIIGGIAGVLLAKLLLYCEKKKIGN